MVSRVWRHRYMDASYMCSYAAGSLLDTVRDVCDNDLKECDGVVQIAIQSVAILRTLAADEAFVRELIDGDAIVVCTRLLLSYTVNYCTVLTTVGLSKYPESFQVGVAHFQRLSKHGQRAGKRLQRVCGRRHSRDHHVDADALGEHFGRTVNPASRDSLPEVFIDYVVLTFSKVSVDPATHAALAQNTNPLKYLLDLISEFTHNEVL
jgi:hypothetical protein